MIEYPKIETLFDRDEKTHGVILDKIRLPEFEMVSRWLVTEKIDGTNVRVHLLPDGSVAYGGRTDAAQMPVTLVNFLRERLPADTVRAAFDPGVEAIVFGEGYGPKIQKGGGDYRADVSFRAFDVAVIGRDRVWWPNWAEVEDVARKLSIKTVPVLARDVSLGATMELVRYPSTTASVDGGKDITHEGIVVRTDPLLLTRSGARLMWKLKGRDFA